MMNKNYTYILNIQSTNGNIDQTELFSSQHEAMKYAARHVHTMLCIEDLFHPEMRSPVGKFNDYEPWSEDQDQFINECCERMNNDVDALNGEFFVMDDLYFDLKMREVPSSVLFQG